MAKKSTGDDAARDTNDKKPQAPVASAPAPIQAEDQMAGMSACMDKFARSFEASARRWETIVYPLLFAFVLLAGYGFFLIYELTNSVKHITANMDVIADRMIQVSDNMQHVTAEMQKVSKDLSQVSDNMGRITLSVSHQDQAMMSMSASLDRMTQSMSMMSNTIYHMRYDTAVMGNNIHKATGPMRFMNAFMPW